jgi:hypothetical protein
LVERFGSALNLNVHFHMLLPDGVYLTDIVCFRGSAKSSVRFDAKAPKEVREHLENIANICNLVFQFFQDDVKTKLWLQTPNPMLGNVSPRRKAIC